MYACADLSSLKDLVQPRDEGEQFDRDALMLALTMVRVSDGVDPMLDTYQTSLWPPLEQCPAEERVRHAYKARCAAARASLRWPCSLSCLAHHSPAAAREHRA